MPKFFTTLLLVASLAGTHHANAASFSCSQAKTNVEKLICTNIELSELDDELHEVYSAYQRFMEYERAPAYEIDELKVAQRNWLKKRSKCLDKACIQESYTARLGSFRSGCSETFPYLPKKLCLEKGLQAADSEVIRAHEDAKKKFGTTRSLDAMHRLWVHWIRSRGWSGNNSIVYSLKTRLQHYQNYSPPKKQVETFALGTLNIEITVSTMWSDYTEDPWLDTVVKQFEVKINGKIVPSHRNELVSYSIGCRQPFTQIEDYLDVTKAGSEDAGYMSLATIMTPSCGSSRTQPERAILLFDKADASKFLFHRFSLQGDTNVHRIEGLKYGFQYEVYRDSNELKSDSDTGVDKRETVISFGQCDQDFSRRTGSMVLAAITSAWTNQRRMNLMQLFERLDGREDLSGPVNLELEQINNTNCGPSFLPDNVWELRRVPEAMVLPLTREGM
jgi:uncharacterized protein